MSDRTDDSMTNLRADFTLSHLQFAVDDEEHLRTSVFWRQLVFRLDLKIGREVCIDTLVGQFERDFARFLYITCDL